MDKSSLPIGVFDSGVGGISVLKSLSALMPNENFIYLGDSANAPYGTKTDEEIARLTKDAIQKLLELGVKCIVIACNTATSVGICEMREFADVPVVGIEPAVKPASLKHCGEKILIMATPVTLKREKFLNLMNSYKDMAEIIPLPCPDLAELIETDLENEEKIVSYLTEILKPFKTEKIGAVVLGCTHYPHIRHLIEKVVDPQTEIYDGAVGTAKETKRQIESMGLLNTSEKKGTIKFITSSNDENEIEFMKKIYNK